jgi:osmoprotectant transport system substrate-binding protein
MIDGCFWGLWHPKTAVDHPHLGAAGEGLDRHGTERVIRVRSGMRWRLRTALVVAALLVLSGCTSGDEPRGGESTPTQRKTVTVGGADFAEAQTLQELYRSLLEDAGYPVEIKRAAQREGYVKSLISGEIDVVPEYAATMAEYLNRVANGPSAAPIASSDLAATLTAMKPLAQAQGLNVLEPTKAANTNGFYVTKEFAQQHKLKSLSELGTLELDITLAAGDECLQPQRIHCAPGLRETYGLKIVGVTGDALGSATGKQKVLAGQAQLGLTGTTDGTLDGLGLVLLEDDKKLQPAENVVPVVNTKEAGDPQIAEALNQLADVLTTADLAKLNLQVEGKRQKPADVAEEYLASKKLV